MNRSQREKYITSIYNRYRDLLKNNVKINITIRPKTVRIRIFGAELSEVTESSVNVLKVNKEKNSFTFESVNEVDSKVKIILIESQARMIFKDVSYDYEFNDLDVSKMNIC